MNKAAHRNRSSFAPLARWSILLLLVSFILAAPVTSAAQNELETIEQLEVQLWPDFDRPSVLANMTALLPSGAQGPFNVTLAIPEDATVHVVAPLREDGRPGPEISYDDSVPGQLSFTADVPGFHVEYYYPYSADGSQRDFTFTWQSAIAVDQLLAVVQQPIMSTDLSTNPGAEGVTTGSDGMQYHRVASEPVAAGSEFSLEGSYSLATPRLSQDVLTEAQGGAGLEELPGATDESEVNWLLVAGVAAGVIAVVVLAWLFFSSRRGSRRVTKPRPMRRDTARPRARARRSATPPPAKSAAKFCHECGQPVEPGDRFCRNCGTPVKNPS